MNVAGYGDKFGTYPIQISSTADGYVHIDHPNFVMPIYIFGILKHSEITLNIRSFRIRVWIFH